MLNSGLSLRWTGAFGHTPSTVAAASEPLPPPGHLWLCFGPVPFPVGEEGHPSIIPQAPAALRHLSVGRAGHCRVVVIRPPHAHPPSFYVCWASWKLCLFVPSPSNRDPHMELREEAWSPGPLDSEDQQMASHENPGEMASGGPQLTLCPPLAPFASPPVTLGLPILPPEALVTGSLSLALASLPPGPGSLQVSF